MMTKNMETNYVSPDIEKQKVPIDTIHEEASTIKHRSTTQCRVSNRLLQPFYSLLFGQFLSVLITATGIASSHLASMGIHMPTTQSFFNYLLLAMVYGPLLIRRRQKQLKVSWHYYMVLAIIDVEANYLAVKAYQYTTMTSVLLLDRGSLLFVILLAWIVFRTKSSLGQFAGISTCMIGVVVLFISDTRLSTSTSHDHHHSRKNYYGDILVIVASFLYAMTNIAEEFLSKKNDFVELMALLGVFGSLVSGCQLCALEIHEIKFIKQNIYEVLPLVGYAVSLFTFYTVVPIFLKANSAILLNLSLITSDMWATCAQNYMYHQKVPILYFVAFSIVALGLLVHSFFSWRLESSEKQDNVHEEEEEEAI